MEIQGTYLWYIFNSDNIEDKDCHTAMVMLGVSDGSGGAGRTRAVRITQHDIVFGLFMAPDQNFPVIMGVLGRTRNTKILVKVWCVDRIHKKFNSRTD